MYLLANQWLTTTTKTHPSGLTTTFTTTCDRQETPKSNKRVKGQKGKKTEDNNKKDKDEKEKKRKIWATSNVFHAVNQDIMQAAVHQERKQMKIQTLKSVQPT